MIERLGIKRMKLAKIVLPGDFKARLKKPHVKALRESLASTGGVPLARPVVQEKTRRAVAGMDRIAALMLAGADMVEVEIVRGAADELADLADVENAHRRHDDRDAAIVRVLERERKRLENKTSGRVEMVQPVPRTTGGAAATTVAKKFNTTPAAVRQAEKRARVKAAPEPGPTEPEPPCIDLYDLPIRAAVEINARAVQVCIDAADKAMRECQAQLKRLEGTDYDGGMRQRLHGMAHTLAHEIRAERPVSACPYCKATIPDCPTCGGRGYVAKLHNVPPDMLLRGMRAIILDGMGGVEPWKDRP